MNWQEQRRQAYEQEQAAKELVKQQAAEQQRRQLKEQFEEQQRRAAQQATERELQAEEQRHREQQQQTAALQRIADGLKLLDEQRETKQREAQEHLKQRKAQESKVWVSQDGREFRSPRERDFWDMWIEDSERASKIPLFPQYHVGRYYLDFAHPETKTAIEIDGRMYHTDQYTFTHDRVRQRTLEKQGWCFIRFSGDEISSNLEDRVIEACEIIQTRLIDCPHQ